MGTTYQEYHLKQFKLQNKTTLDLKLAYKTYGKLNQTKSNVVLFPTYFAGRHEGNEWLIGKGKALDPAKYFIIVPNLFGNGLSSSPSNTIGEYSGAKFPQTTVYDNVKAQYLLLTEHFGISRIHLAIGWSLGAMQVYFWSALFPKMIEKMVAFGGSFKNSTRFRLIANTVITALKTDKNWKNGHYEIPPEKGIRLMANIYCPWAYSHSYFQDGTYLKPPKVSSLEDFIERRWEKAFLMHDANDLLVMLQTGFNGELADFDQFGGDQEKALQAIKAKVLLMPGSTDLLFPVEDSIREAAHIADATVVPIPSAWGHDSGIGANKVDNNYIDKQLKIFLSK